MKCVHFTNGSSNSSAAWAARADELAAWAMARLANRRDCRGTYSPPERRGQPYIRRDGALAKVPVNYMAKGTLTRNLLARHFRGLLWKTTAIRRVRKRQPPRLKTAAEGLSPSSGDGAGVRNHTPYAHP
jgi:hypothetical protein